MATKEAIARSTGSPRDDGRSFHQGPTSGRRTLGVDEENFQQNLSDLDNYGPAVEESRLSSGSGLIGNTAGGVPPSARQQFPFRKAHNRWPVADEDADNDVPASLLVENNDTNIIHPVAEATRPIPALARPADEHWSDERLRQLDSAYERQDPYDDSTHKDNGKPRAVVSTHGLHRRNEAALWRWVNTTNLDSFMRDVYDYYEGGGIWCILCSNALWLL